MPNEAALVAFALAAFALTVLPGPDVLFVVTQALERGRRAGLVSTLGTATGTLGHVLAASAGLSALLASSATSFQIVKFAGAGYLVVLGLRRLFGGERPSPSATAQGEALAPVYRRAVAVAALNPKTGLFFVAFLPQFVRVGHGSTALQIFFLGLLFTLIGLASDSAYALFASAAGSRLRRAGAERIRRYLSGATLVGLGVAAAGTNR